VLFRGQPDVEEETDEFDDDDNPKIKRRKADDEHLIRKAMLNARWIDAVISLPLNVFYGAGVPACLLILRKHRPPERRDQVLLIYAARHYRELSAQNELRPQDVMRMLVHYHAYGDAAKVSGLVAEYSGRIRKQIDLREEDEVGRLQAEYQAHADKLAGMDTEISAAQTRRNAAKTKGDKAATEAAITNLQKRRDKAALKVAERDTQVAEAQRRAEDDRQDVAKVGHELVALYADGEELLKHARVVGLDEIEENEFNLNIPRYVDTFEPEPRVEVSVALKALAEAENAAQEAERSLSRLLKRVGYATD
jgi:type I restriction enzyme M protein